MKAYPCLAENEILFPSPVGETNLTCSVRRPNLSFSRDLVRLLRLIHSLTGFDASPYRESTLRRRLQLRLQATGCRTINDYISFIRQNPQEAGNFQENLLIHVSRFFRDRPVFSYLERRVLPSLLDNLCWRQRRTLRIWSVGCASGQEPFTLAMILHGPVVERGLHPIILATDVSWRVLARAREALFTRHDLRPIPKPLRKAYFLEERPGFYRVSSLLRRMVVFRQHDFVHEVPPGKFDLVLCRNVLIFFQPEIHDFLLQKITQSITPGGVLVLGRSESIISHDGLRPLSGRFHIYQKAKGEPEHQENKENSSRGRRREK